MTVKGVKLKSESFFSISPGVLELWMKNLRGGFCPPPTPRAWIGLKVYILETTRTYYVKHEFSDCRCDIVFVRHKDIFLTTVSHKFVQQKLNLTSFQSLAP